MPITLPLVRAWAVDVLVGQFTKYQDRLSGAQGTGFTGSHRNVTLSV